MDHGTALQAAVQAANRAGSYIKERLGNIDRIDYKSAFNLVTDVDKASESLILEILRSQFPADGFLAEEGSGTENTSGRRWLIDPLDGTTNFAHTYPFFAVSIALEVDGTVEVGVVFNPVSGELFTAQRGKGAFLNDKKIHVSSIASLEQSLLATGFPADARNSANNNLDAFSTVTSLCHGVRRDGSAALDLSYVACGRLEGFWERKLAPWDIGAGLLLVTEAGGKVTDLDNGKLDIAKGHILATNGLVHDAVVKVLAEVSAAKSSK